MSSRPWTAKRKRTGKAETYLERAYPELLDQNERLEGRVKLCVAALRWISKRSKGAVHRRCLETLAKITGTGGIADGIDDGNFKG